MFCLSISSICFSDTLDESKVVGVEGDVTLEAKILGVLLGSLFRFVFDNDLLYSVIFGILFVGSTTVIFHKYPISINILPILNKKLLLLLLTLPDKA